MANDEFRDQQQASREVGLKARHETRVERAIRRQVAEEIATALGVRSDQATEEITEARNDRQEVAKIAHYRSALMWAASKAREIGAKETP